MRRWRRVGEEKQGEEETAPGGRHIRELGMLGSRDGLRQRSQQ